MKNLYHYENDSQDYSSQCEVKAFFEYGSFGQEHPKSRNNEKQ